MNQNIKIVLIKFIAGVFTSIFLGLFGLIMGAYFGSAFLNNYEKGGVYGICFGLVVGNLMGVLLVKKEKYSSAQYILASIFGISLFIFYYYGLELMSNSVSQLIFWAVIILSPLILVLAINWQKLFKIKSR